MGRTVQQLHLIAPPGQGPELLGKIPLREGDRLERDKLRDSLRVLYESGRFAEVAVDAVAAFGRSGRGVPDQAELLQRQRDGDADFPRAARMKPRW